MAQPDQNRQLGSDEQSEWLTLGRAARYLGVAQSTIRKWCDAGRVRAFKTPGGHRRFLKSDLDEFLERSRPAARGGGPRVLVVDNEPGVGAYLRASLEPGGYRLEQATTAEQGLRLTEEKSPGLVLISAGMPDDQGWELLRRLRERFGQSTLPVVIYSESGRGDERLARKRGAAGFFGKPLDPSRLVELARQVLPL